MYKKLFGKHIDLNMLTFNDYYDRLKLIALSLFKWENLPSSCNERFLEKTLFHHGRCLFFYDETLGFLNTKTTPSGELNIYDEPIRYTAYGINYQKTLDKEECVLIRNNYLERPTEETVILFALRLAECERTIDTNIKAQKTPILVRVDEKDRLTIKNLYKQYDGNEPFILGGKSLNPEGLKVMKTDAPFITDKLQRYKYNLWNEIMTFFGINNTNTEKRERLTDDEVNSNNEIIFINAQSMLLAREQAVKEINNKFNLNIKVTMRKFNERREEDWQNIPLNLEI